MLKFIESKKIEYYLLAIYIVAIAVSLLDFKQRLIMLVLILIPAFLLYLIRIFTSFRHWKFSKGISILNAYLNFQMLNIVLAIAYLFLGWPGRYLMLNTTIAGPKFFLIVIGIFLIIRWRDLNKPIYWNYLKENIIKALIGTAICVILYFTVEIPDTILIQP